MTERVRSKAPLRLICCLVWFLLCFATLDAAFAEVAGLDPDPLAICTSPSDSVTVTALRVVGTDLHVSMAALPGVSWVQMSLTTADGKLIQTATASSGGSILPPGLKKEPESTTPLPDTLVFAGAMDDALSRGIGYWLAATDSKGAIAMEPVPFLLSIDCPNKGACSFEPQPGLMTSGLWVTPELLVEIRKKGSCDLPAIVEQIAADIQGPALRADLFTLGHQLSMMPQAPASLCRYAWLTVASKNIQAWQSGEDGDGNRWEYGGAEAGAAVCVTGQAQDAEGKAWELPTNEWGGRSAIEVEIQCIQGPPSCDGRCRGRITPVFEYSGCAKAEAWAYECGGGAKATATLTTDLLLQGQTVLTFDHVGAAAVTEGLEYVAAPSYLEHESSTVTTLGLLTPFVGEIDGYGRVDAGAGNDGCGGSGEPGGTDLTAWAWAEVSNHFKLEAFGAPIFSPASFCGDLDEVYTVIQTPTDADVVLRALGGSASGGTKIERWRNEPPGG